MKMRKKFFDLFRLRDNGEIVPKYAIRIGGSCVSPGVSFKRGAVFNGVDIFSLQITGVPVLIHLPKKRPFQEIKEFPLFQFWDYLGSNSSEGEEILWDSIKSPILVFQNGGLPPITDFGSIGSEGTYLKVRSFGETIIHKKYNLFGVIMLHGTRPGKNGGSHYTAYIKTKGGQWYSYDDIGPVFKRCTTPKVFNESGGSKPEMYFYQKTSFFLF